MKRRLRVLAALTALTLITAACAGAGPAPAASPSPTTAARPSATAPAAKPGELDADTVAKAKSEGTVSWYTSMNEDDAKYLAQKFEASASNPGLKVMLNRKSSERIVSQLLTEIKAGQILADVLETGGLDVAKPISEGYVEEFRPPAAADFPASLKDEKGFWTAGRLTVETVAWNTTLVKAADEPKGFEDMADPKWKGKMLIEASDVEVMLGLAKRKYNGDDTKLRDYFTRLAANQPQPSNGHTETLDLLIAGQRAAFWGAQGHTVEQRKAAGAPVDYMRGEGVVTIDGPVLIKGAKHRNAGKVFLNWYLSEEGQRAISDRRRIPARPGLADPKLLPQTPFYSGPQFLPDFDKYQKLWKEILGLR